jgi:hypothetical protein
LPGPASDKEEKMKSRILLAVPLLVLLLAGCGIEVISGIGNVSYYGSPRLNKDVGGTGDVTGLGGK